MKNSSLKLMLHPVAVLDIYHWVGTKHHWVKGRAGCGCSGWCKEAVAGPSLKGMTPKNFEMLIVNSGNQYAFEW